MDFGFEIPEIRMTFVEIVESRLGPLEGRKGIVRRTGHREELKCFEQFRAGDLRIRSAVRPMSESCERIRPIRRVQVATS